LSARREVEWRVVLFLGVVGSPVLKEMAHGCSRPEQPEFYLRLMHA
jgi:hypothetical protein